MNRAFIALAVVALASSVRAGSFDINFEEFPASNGVETFLTNEYFPTHGVTFVTSDDGSIWGGNSNGNPGSWNLEGTNGPQFLGFNGNSYGADILFASDISGFMLDVSRSLGSESGDTFTLIGFNNGSQVDAVVITLLDINEWSTVGLNGSVDQVRLLGNGVAFHPFGVDNLRWVPSPAGATMAGLCLIAGLRRRR